MNNIITPVNVPRQVHIQCKNVPNDAAFPSQVQLGPTAVMAFGGLTKLEYAAIHIASGEHSVSCEAIVARAQAILDACAAEQAQKQAEQPEG